MITLTTDFGIQDWFVGTIKGVILGIAAEVRIVDLTHGIPAGDIRAGAFALLAAYRHFPKGTIHVVVVDPGVGTGRRGIAVRTNDYRFVAPDNGVLSFALRKERIRDARVLEAKEYFLPSVSRTFHARDVFAPVAAHLSRGVPLSRLGRRADSIERIPWPETRRTGGGLRGEVIYVDHFGNAITSLEEETTRAERCGELVVVRGRRFCPVRQSYQSVPAGSPVAVFGSSGLLEIAVNGGSAARRFGLRIGTPVRLGRASPSPSL